MANDADECKPKDEWWKFFGARFRDGVRGLEADEIGVYILVLTLIYEAADGSIADDEVEIAKAISMDRRVWRRVRAVLLGKGKLRLKDGRLSNKTADLVLAKRRAKGPPAREIGATSGELFAEFSRNSAELPADLSVEEEVKSPCRKEKNRPRGSLRALAKSQESKKEDSTSNLHLIDEGWALDAAAIEDGLSVGLSKAEVELAADQHVAWWSQNQPNARKTPEGWANVWRARLDDLADDPEQRARLKRKAGSKKHTLREPPPAPNVGEAPAWWVEAAALLREAAPTIWTSYWSQVVATDERGIVEARSPSVVDGVNLSCASEARSVLGFDIEARRAA